MAKQIFYGEAILNDEIVIATVVKNEPPDGVTAVDFEISFAEPAHNEVRFSRSVTISEIALGARHIPREDQDLGMKLVQFHKSLRKQITDEKTDPFEYPKWERGDLLFRIGQLLRVYFVTRPRSSLAIALIKNSLPASTNDVILGLEFFAQNNVLKRSPEQNGKTYFAVEGWHSVLNQILSDLSFSMQSSGKTTERTEIKAEAEIVPTAEAEGTFITGLCSVFLANGHECGRESNEAVTTPCILHDPNPGKNLDDFSDEVFKTLARGGQLDFTAATVPSGFQFDESWVQGGKVLWDRSIFHGPVSIIHLAHTNEISFEGCVFKSDVEWLYTAAEYVNFKNCHFLADARFAGADNLRGMDFEGATFHNGVYVNDTARGGNSYSFTDAVFKGGLVFRSHCDIGTDANRIFLRNATFELPGAVYFYGATFLRLALAGSDVKGVNFINCDIGLGGEKGAIYDEGQIEEDYDDPEVNYTADNVIESYQQLQVSMLRSKNYSSAGAFYTREKATQRKYSSPRSIIFWLNWLYYLVANYAESAWRPVAFLALILCVIPLVQQFGMGKVNFEWTGEWSDFKEYGFDGWCKAVIENLKAVVYFGSDPFKEGGIYSDIVKPHLAWNLVIIVEKIVVAVLGSFVVIALRRRFKRY